MMVLSTSREQCWTIKSLRLYLQIIGCDHLNTSLRKEWKINSVI